MVLPRARSSTASFVLERVGKSGDEPDQFSLPLGAGLFEQAADIVLTVLGAMPSFAATSGAPPISTMASRTRNSVGVRLSGSRDDVGRPRALHARLINQHCGKGFLRAVAV